MPNWCNNTLKVTGNPEQLKEFVSKTVSTPETGTEEFKMNNLYPTPPELLEEKAFANSENSEALVKKYGASDWYDWRVNNWGTKWDIGECYILENTDELFQVSFDSAWSPPCPFLKYASEQYPELNFSMVFDEPGNDFCGIYNISRGGQDEIIEEGSYIYQDDDSREVEFDSDNQKWKYTDSGEMIEEEDFFPNGINPFEEDF
jgi:hypothetical protein